MPKIYTRPMVEVELFSGEGSVATMALVDSGADYCIFNVEFANALGINLAECKVESTVGVAGVPIETYKTTIEIQVKYLDRIELPVAFINSQSVNGLLGQHVFFDTYRIKFERDHGVFEISKSMRAKKKGRKK